MKLDDERTTVDMGGGWAAAFTVVALAVLGIVAAALLLVRDWIWHTVAPALAVLAPAAAVMVLIVCVVVVWAVRANGRQPTYYDRVHRRRRPPVEIVVDVDMGDPPARRVIRQAAAGRVLPADTTAWWRPPPLPPTDRTEDRR